MEYQIINKAKLFRLHHLPKRNNLIQRPQTIIGECCYINYQLFFIMHGQFQAIL